MYRDQQQVNMCTYMKFVIKTWLNELDNHSQKSVK